MTTALTRQIVRETEVEIDGKKLLIYLDPDQKIGFKLKGLRSEPYFFNIIYAYNKLMQGDESHDLTTDKKEELTKDETLCAKTIIKDIQKETNLPYPYKRELVKYFRKKYGA